MGEAPFPAVQFALLKLVESDEHGPAESADDLHQFLKPQPRALLRIGIGDAHAGNDGVDLQPAQIVERLILAEQHAQNGRDSAFACGRNARRAGEAAADAAHQSFELGLADADVAVISRLLQPLRDVAGHEIEQRISERNQRHRRAFRHEIGLAQARHEATRQPGVELRLGNEFHHRQHDREHIAMPMQAAYGGQQRVCLAGAGLPLDQQ